MIAQLPLREIIELFSQIRKKNNKSIYQYQCLCKKSFGNHSERFRKHATRCLIFLQEFRLRNFTKEKVLIQQVVLQKNSKEAPIAEFNQMYQLKRRIFSLQNKLALVNQQTEQYIKNINSAKYLSQTLVEDISSQVLHILKDNISEVIYQMRNQTTTSIQQLVSTIKKNVLILLREMDFYSLLDDYSYQINQIQKQILEQKKNDQSLNNKRLLAKYKRGFSFWNSFKSLKNYPMVMQKIKQLKTNQKKQALLYYRILKRKMPKIPKISEQIFLKRNIIRQQIKKMTLQDFRDVVTYFSNRGSFTEACDFWCCVCLGIRAPDILEIYFQEDGYFFDAIQIMQSKNKNLVIKPVPQSLKKIIKKYKISYPMTQQRLIQMRSIAKSLRKRFYGYRSASITAMAIAFSSTIHTHRNPKTTLQYYLDLENLQLIDNIFSLPFLQNQQTIPRSGLILRETDTGMKITKIIQNQVLFSLQNLYSTTEVEQQEDIQDVALLGKESFQSTQISSTEEKQFLLCEKIYNTFNIHISGIKFQTMFQALSFCFSRQRKFQNIVQSYKTKVKEMQPDLSFQVILEKTIRDLYHVHVFIIKVKQNQHLSLQSINIPEKKKNVIILIQTLQKDQVFYRASDHRIVWDKTLLRTKYLSNINYFEKEKLLFTKSRIKCLACNACINDIEICKYHYMLQCEQGHTQTHHCLSVLDSLKTVTRFHLKIQSKINKQYKLNFKPCHFENDINNIQQTVALDLRKYINNYEYYNTIPQLQIITNQLFSCTQATEIILENRKNERWLPLKIEDHEYKGKGVISTAKIAKDTLICSYLGRIGTNQNSFTADDSLFLLGKLKNTSNYMTELIIIGRQACNVGRYFNSPSQNESANLRAQTVLLELQDNKTQLGIIYVTNQDINAGDWLQIDYGSNFWKHEEVNVSQSQYVIEEETMDEVELIILLFVNKKYKNYPYQFRHYLFRQANQSSFIRSQIQSLRYRHDQQKYRQIVDFSCLSKLAPNQMKKNELIFGYQQTIKSLALNYPQQNIKKYLLQFSKQFQFRRKVKGDGLCFYRIIGYYCLTKVQLKTRVFQGVNSLISQTDSFKKLRYSFQKAKPSCEEQILNFWNSTENCDHLIIQRIKQIFVEEISSNVEFYSKFTQFSKKDQLINLANMEADDLTITALCNSLYIYLTIYKITEKGIMKTIINQKGVHIFEIFLRSQHYQICFNKKK